MEHIIEQAYADSWRDLATFSELLHLVSKGGNDFDHGPVTITQARIFGYLFRHHDETIQLKNIAHDLDVTSAAASQTIEKLVHEGLVKRIPDPNDRRAVNISFSEEGLKLVEKISEEHRKLMHDLLEGIPLEEISVFMKVFHHMHSELCKRWQFILDQKDSAAKSISK